MNAMRKKRRRISDFQNNLIIRCHPETTDDDIRRTIK
jgi:hypothetical protein